MFTYQQAILFANKALIRNTPVVWWNLQAQLLHQHDHDIITAGRNFQDCCTILWGPLLVHNKCNQCSDGLFVKQINK